MENINHMLEQPIVPIYRYDMNNPPFIIHVNHEVLGGMVGFIAVTIANEIADKAYNNNARMLCFNLLVDCNYRNESLQEVYNLVIGTLSLNILKNGIRNLQGMIKEDVSNVLTMFTGCLIFRYEALKSTCTPQIINAAQQNLATFNNLKQEISSMYSNNGMPMQNNMPMNNGMPMQNNMPMNNGMPMQNNGMQGYNNNPNVSQQLQINGVPVFNNNGILVYANGMPVQQNNNMPMQNNNMPQQMNRPAPITGQNLSLNENKHSQINQLTKPVRPVYQPVQQVVAEVPETKPYSIEKLQIIGGSEMERSKHRITVLGQNLVLPVQERIHDFNNSMQDFCNVIKENDSDLVILPSSVHGEIVAAVNIDSAINTVRILKITSKNSKNSLSIFRCFCMITEPIAFTESTRMADIMSVLIKPSKLDELAVSLGNIARSINLESIKDDDEIVLNFITTINNKLTAMINSFFKNELRMDLEIDDFIEDGDGLEKYLTSKKGIEYKNAYINYGNKVISWLFQGSNTEFVDLTIGELDLPEDMTVGFTNTFCSVTLVDVTSQELGMEMDNRSYYIDPVTAPLIYNLVDTLTIHDVDNGLSTLDILITSDGVRYKLYRDYLKDGKYLISKL